MNASNLVHKKSVNSICAVTGTDRNDYLGLLEVVTSSEDGTIRVWGFSQDDGLKALDGEYALRFEQAVEDGERRTPFLLGKEDAQASPTYGPQLIRV